MKRIVRLTESDLSRIVRRVIRENRLLMEDAAADLENQFNSANPGYKLESTTMTGTKDAIIVSSATQQQVASYDCTNNRVKSNMVKFQQSIPTIQQYCKVAFV